LNQSFRYDARLSRQRREVVAALAGALLVDTHDDLRAAWRRLATRNLPRQLSRSSASRPFSEAEALKLAQASGSNRCAQSQKDRVANLGRKEVSSFRPELMRVAVKNLSKNFGQTPALRGVSLEIQSQELFFFLGPSGCGKTTLLRLIAGFYEPDSGDMFFGERTMTGVPPHRRNTGMVFQNYALWPHMTVAQNVAYGLEVRSIAKDEKTRRVGEALEIVRMNPYAQRFPNQLSGGQQQRVALARALVIRPDVLLLDEPLSNLDAKLRLEMREEIRRIHAETRITTIYVTHDQKEALSMAGGSQLCAMGSRTGGEPRFVYRKPASRFVADFMGDTNWLRAEVSRNSTEGLVFETEIGMFTAAETTRARRAARFARFSA
jgi:iron(III) transport system ATP-binding protein